MPCSFQPNAHTNTFYPTLFFRFTPLLTETLLIASLHYYSIYILKRDKLTGLESCHPLSFFDFSYISVPKLVPREKLECL